MFLVHKYSIFDVKTFQNKSNVINNIISKCFQKIIMSRDLNVLGQHKFNVEDRLELMQEISKSFESNVYYGFCTGYDWVKDKLPTFESIGIENPESDEPGHKTYLLDKYLIQGNNKQLSLLEDEYIYKWYVDEYGLAAGARDEFKKSWTDEVDTNNEILKDFSESFYPIDLHFENIFASINKESIEVGYNEFFMDWWNFFSLVLREKHWHYGLWQTKENFESFLAFRNSNKNTILKCGGNCAFYYDWQGEETGSVAQNEWEMNWNEIENGFRKVSEMGKMINLCDLLTDKRYLEKMQELTINSPKEYSVFYDDFRELSIEDIYMLEEE
jgi:hypothetical protein